MPIYELIPSSRRHLYSATDIIYILLSPHMNDSNLICSRVPTSIQKNGSFVVDTAKLGERTDFLANDMGVWINNGVDTKYYSVSVSGNGEIESVSPANVGGLSVYTMNRVYRIHGTNRSLKKLTAEIECMLI